MGTYNVHGGHNSIVPGANMYLNEVTEDRSVKDKVIAYLRTAGHTAYDCTDDSGTTQSRNLSNIVAKCNAHSVDLDISIHLNAGGGTGTEVWYYTGDGTGKSKAAAVSAAVAKALGIKDRGPKPSSDLYVLRNTEATAILVECCFVDSQTDAAAWSADKCAKAIVEAVTGSAVSGGSVSSGGTVPSGAASGYTGSSIVDYLKSIGKDSSFAARQQYAAQYGISGYSGTAAQNTQLLNAMRGGAAVSSGVSYYPAFSSASIVDGLKSIGVDSSFSHRSKIAAANGISGYSGTAAQNNKLCSLAKQGKLKKA